MTGLEKIIEQIKSESTEQCDKIIAQANVEANEIENEAQKQAKLLAQQAEAMTVAKQKDILDRAKSGAELEKSRALLAAKQKAIGEALQKSKQRLKELPDDEYFKLLKRMAIKNASKQDASIAFCQKDADRLPSDFIKSLSKELGVKITLAPVDNSIDSGFILIYGGIEENCSLDAVFASEAERLSDLAANLLFEA